MYYARLPWMLGAGTLMMAASVCWFYTTVYSQRAEAAAAADASSASSWSLFHYGQENNADGDRRPVTTFAFPKYPPPTRLANLTDFQFTINPDICARDEEVFMLVLVGSHPRNVSVRQIIRKTLGNPEIDGHLFKVVFVFGNVTNRKWQDIVEQESVTHQDIVQGNFVDAYRNMSYRDIMALRWAWQFCGQAKYVAHVDDDVSLNVFELTRVLERDFGGAERSSRYFMGCMMMLGGQPVLRRGRYAVTFEDYPDTVYEKYCSGWTYVVTPEMAYLLDMAALRVPTFWLNDVFITGMLVRALEMTQRKLNVTSTLKLKNMVAMAEQSEELPLNYSLGYVAQNEQLIVKLHQKYKAAYYKRISS